MGLRVKTASVPFLERSWIVPGADSRRICWADAKMPGGLEPPGTVFSTCNKHGIFGGKTGTVCQLSFLFCFIGLRGFSTGEGLDKAFSRAPEAVQMGRNRRRREGLKSLRESLG
jgi:hypothetical protein